jgi:hypothetical protein
LLNAVERPASIKELFMVFEVSPDGSNASITVSPTASDKSGSAWRAAPMRKPSSTIESPADSKRSDTGKDTTWIPWIPVVVPLLALLPALAAYIIGWGAIAGTH